MLRFGLLGLIGALTFLASTSETDAVAGVCPSVTDSRRDRGIVEIAQRGTFMAGTAACGIMAASPGRLVCGREWLALAVGTTASGVDPKFGDVDCLGRGDALLKIRMRVSSQLDHGRQNYAPKESRKCSQYPNSQ